MPLSVVGLVVMGVALAVLAWVASSTRRIGPRHAVRPQVDNGRVVTVKTGPTVTRRVELAPMASVEPPHTPHSIARPYVLAYLAARTSQVACRVCRDGAEVIGERCILCGCEARAVAR
jgi:hypothetical protein